MVILMLSLNLMYIYMYSVLLVIFTIVLIIINDSHTVCVVQYCILSMISRVDFSKLAK